MQLEPTHIWIKCIEDELESLYIGKRQGFMVHLHPPFNEFYPEVNWNDLRKFIYGNKMNTALIKNPTKINLIVLKCNILEFIKHIKPV